MSRSLSPRPSKLFKPMRRILHTLCLALTPLLFGACQANAATVECIASPGVDPASAEGLCQALRVARPAVAVRLNILATTQSSISARLDRLPEADHKSGQRMDFNTMDRDLNITDFDDFARDLLRFGLTY